VCDCAVASEAGRTSAGAVLGADASRGAWAGCIGDATVRRPCVVEPGCAGAGVRGASTERAAGAGPEATRPAATGPDATAPDAAGPDAPEPEVSTECVAGRAAWIAAPEVQAGTRAAGAAVAVGLACAARAASSRARSASRSSRRVRGAGGTMLSVDPTSTSRPNQGPRSAARCELVEACPRHRPGAARRNRTMPTSTPARSRNHNGSSRPVQAPGRVSNGRHGHSSRESHPTRRTTRRPRTYEVGADGLM
jgi:hypothetical protein